MTSHQTKNLEMIQSIENKTMKDNEKKLKLIEKKKQELLSCGIIYYNLIN